MLESTPIVFVAIQDPTACQSIELFIRCRGWRVEFLPARPDEASLLRAIDDAVERAAAGDDIEMACMRARYASLTRREREVMALVVSGLLNKQAGVQLGTSEITVKAHRGQVMRKMEAGSFAELVRMASRLGLPPHARAAGTAMHSDPVPTTVRYDNAHRADLAYSARG